MAVNVEPARRPLRGEIRVPGDKSLSHRALILASLAGGPSRIRGLAPGADVASTGDCLRGLGVGITRPGGGPDGDTVVTPPRCGLLPPSGPLDAGNSGTTMRLLAGILAAQPFRSTLSGDRSLRRRPMSRIAEPLRRMGARVVARGREGDGETAPLEFRGPLPPRPLTPATHRLPVASAQVKSCLLLAGLHACGRTTVVEPVRSRDHTERLLARFGVPVDVADSPDGHKVSVTSEGLPRLTPADLEVPGDISSAAFWIVAALLVPGSELRLTGVGVNPTRTGLLEVLRRMGADIRLETTRVAVSAAGDEPVADIVVLTAGPGRSARSRGSGRAETGLEGTVVTAEELPSLIDEIPVLAVAATQAAGTTVVEGAGELRVKESDRLTALAVELGRMGAGIEIDGDRLIIEGGPPLRAGRVWAHGDHRMAMALGVAGLAGGSGHPTVVDGAEAASVSYPGFWTELARVAG